jgi:hypothetical protein
MKHRTLVPTVLTALLAATSLGAAAQQKLLPAQSELAFTARQMGVPVSGHFRKFDAQVNFDASKLASSKVDLTVDMGSATLGSAEMDKRITQSPLVQCAQVSTSQVQLQQHSRARWWQVRDDWPAQHQGADPGGAGAADHDPDRRDLDGQRCAADQTPWLSRLVMATGLTPRWWADDVQVSFKFALSGVAKL